MVFEEISVILFFLVVLPRSVKMGKPVCDLRPRCSLSYYPDNQISRFGLSLENYVFFRKSKNFPVLKHGSRIPITAQIYTITVSSVWKHFCASLEVLLQIEHFIVELHSLDFAIAEARYLEPERK